MEEKDRFEEVIIRARQRFLLKLQDLLPAFELFVHELNNGDSFTYSMDNIATKAHQLSGSAMTFDFENIDRYARDIEQKIHQMEKAKESERDAIAESLSESSYDLLDEIHRLVNSEFKISDDGYPFFEIEEEPEKAYKYHILVADDDELVRDVLKNGLKNELCNIIQAADGEHVLDMVKKKSPDLVILDMKMPKLGGIETLKKLKSSKKTKDIPVIMLSKLSDDKHINEALSAGALDYIVKPFDMTNLIDRVKKILINN